MKTWKMAIISVLVSLMCYIIVGLFELSDKAMMTIIIYLVFLNLLDKPTTQNKNKQQGDNDGM